MSNPHSNPQTSSWMERMAARTRQALRRMNVAGGEAKNSRGWMIALVVCALLIGGISLAALGREGTTKKEEATGSNAPPKAEAAATKAPVSQPKGGVTSKSNTSAKEKGADKETAPEKIAEGEKEPNAATPQEFAGAWGKTAAENEEQEGADFLRARAEWFYRQRAYPLGRIPAGVRQRAIEHRKAMEARQQLEQAGAAGLAAPASTGQPAASPQATPPIAFPGPANWTPIGPQPISSGPFTGANFGNPSASGRVLSIAPDPSDATHKTFYLGAADGGVWKTTDTGATWVPLTDNQPSLSMGAVQVSPVAGHNNIIYAATGEQNSFGFDNYFGAGVLKSIDSGTTWTQTGTPAGAPFVGPFSGISFANSFFGGAHISSVAINPANDNLVLVGVQFGGTAGIDPPGHQSGVYCTNDGGSNWNPIATASTTMASFVGFASSKVAYAGIGYPFGDANNGIYVSANADGGVGNLCSNITFAKSAGTGLPPQGNTGRIILGLAPSDATGKTAYAAIANSAAGSNTLQVFLKTIDGGLNWTTQTPAASGFCNNQCWYDMAVGVDPANANNIAVGGSAFTNNSSTVWLSTNGGTSWTDITTGATAPRPHVDTHSIVFIPGTTILFTGDDGGVWRTDNYTTSPPTWVGLNSTLQITQHYPSLSVSRTDSNLAYAGAQDNGTDAFTGSSAWTHVACGDGGFTALDPQFDTTVYAACQNITILKSYFNGAPGTFVPAFLTGFGADRHSFISPLVHGPATGLLYFGTFRVYQTTNGGDLWTPISPDLTADGASNVTTIAISPTNPDVVYAGTGDGQIQRTTNATTGSAAIWTNLTKTPLPPRAITSVWVDDTDPNRAWVAFSGFSGFSDIVGHLFQTTDGGATWTDVSCTAANCGTPNPSDLPNTPVNEVKFASRQNSLFVGTDVGVFTSVLGSGTWSVVGTGFPHAVVLSLNASRRGDIGFAATHGRGTWIIGLPRAIPAGAFLTSISQSSTTAPGSAFVMTLDGAHFTASSAVMWDGAANGIITTFGSANQLTAAIPSALLTTAGQHSVTVSDPAGTSGQIEFNIMSPAPTLSFISPTSGAAGSLVTITATGSGFINGSTQLVFNGTLVPGTVTGGTTLMANVPAALVNASGVVPVDVFNPQPGGGDSGNPQAFTINAPVATITSIAPSSVAAGGPGFQLTITGTNFASNASVSINGGVRPVTFVSSTQLLAAVSAGLSAGLEPVTVTNPGDAASTAVNLTVTSTPNLVPAITSLSPNPVAAGTNFLLTVNGSNFVGNSVVQVNGLPVSTTYVSATQLTAGVSSSEVATPGSVPITVFNPLPGGGTSAASNLTVNSAVPTITSLSPNSAPAGSPAGKMTVNGTNFDGSSVVKFNGNARVTTLVNSRQLIANILASDLATAGSFPVTVANTGGTSSSVTFTVTGAAVCTINFVPASGAWETATNWDLTRLPNSSDVACIASGKTATLGSGTQTISTLSAANGSTLNINGGSLTFSSASTAGNLSIGGGTLTANGNLTVAGAFSLAGTSTSILNGTGAVNLNGAATWSGSSHMAGSGTTNVNAGMTIVSSAPLVDGRSLFNNSGSTLSISGGGANNGLFCNNGATLQNQAGGTWNLQDDNGVFLSAGGTGVCNFTNNGTLNRTTTSGTASISIFDFMNAGVVNVNTGTLLISRGSSHTGSFVVGSGSTLRISQTQIFTASSSVSGAGSVLLDNTSQPTFAGTYNITGGTSFAGNTLDFTGTVNAVGPLTLTAGSTNISKTGPAGPLSIPSLSCTSSALGGTSDLTITGAASISNCSVTTTGAFNIAATGTLLITSATTTNVVNDGFSGTTVNLAGAGTWNNAADIALSNGAVFNILSTGSLDVQSDRNMGGPAPSTVNNAGLLKKSGVGFGGGSTNIGSPFSNTGTVSINVGTIVFSSTYTQTSGSTILNGNLSMGGGTLTLTGGTLSGTGTFTGTVNNTGGVVKPGLSPGTLTITGNYTQGAGGSLNIELAGTGAGQFGLLAISGAATLGGTLNVLPFGGFTPPASSNYQVATYASHTGDFATKNLTVSGVVLNEATNATNVTLTAPAANNPVPTTTSISPTSATAGVAAFTLTVNGTNFIASSVVNFNGAARTTTFVSATQLTAAILAADIATAGTPSVTVFNPAPGGGTSNAQTFTINNPAPTITSLSPTGATAGGAGFTLTVNGTGFVATSSVKFNGAARVTTFVSATQVTAAILASDISTVGTPPVTVTNPAPGGGTSAPVNFNVSAANNPVPTLASISPTSATTGGAAFTLTLTGTNFIASSTVSFGANPQLSPTSQTATQLQVTVPASDITTGGSVSVTVTNPAPGGGTTSAQTFTVNNPAATITSLSPTSATAGGAAFTLTINGTNFVSGATGTFNGNARTVTFVNSTQVTMAVTAPDIATAGSFPVVVSNPAPGGGSTGAVLFTVNNVLPTLTSISPTSATAGGAAFTLTLNGTGFVSGSTVKFGVAAPTATFASATQLTAAITAADIATAGVVNVSVTNPAPGGGTSGIQTFSINNPVPSITSLAPASASAGGAAFTLTINGASFVSGATGTFNGAARTVTFVSATQVTMAVTAADIATGGSFPVVVSNPGPGGGASAPSNFTVNNSVPTITSLAPSSATAGGAAFTLTVNGTNLVATSVVNFNGAARTTTFVSATQVTAAITAADIATAGTPSVTVTNPAPGGGTSAGSTFTINNPAPTITTLSPTSATVGGAAFTLTVNGSGFVASSAVKFNGNAKTTTFVSATQVTAAITAADIAAAGIFPVTVTNAAPGGGTSTAANFTVNNPVPTITTLVPSSATAGGAAFTLTVNGTNFVSGASATFGGAARTTTFVNATQVTVAVTAADIATAGTPPVVVTNPAPGGGASAPMTFTVNNPLPTISSLSPTGATAGGAAFTLTVNGTGFLATSQVKFNSNARTTTFVSATQLTAAITAADIAAVGTPPVTVTNPAPGGGTSTPVNFNVSAASNPVPTLTSISPTSATAGGAAFTLTLTGTNFIASSTVSFGANPPLTPTSQTATQIQVTVPVGDIATAGSLNVTVTNPAPGGGTTAAQTFTVNNPAPTITTLSPTSATAGGAAFTLTVNGTGFVAGSAVKFNGNAKTTTFVSATQITAAITAADIATAGSLPVTVTNAAPGGGTSAPTNFTVNNPVPTIATLSPTSASAGGAAFTLTVNGTGFVATSIVNFNGAAKTTTFVSATQVTSAITAADIATAGSFLVTVTNPAPGGGTSAAVNFAVNNPLPTITSLSPNTLVAGGAAFTLTVNGTNFISTSQVKFNGTARTTAFVSATQITAAILASDIATSGNANVTVTNPTPGGGTTANFVFVITSAPNPVPTLTSIAPTTATAGGAAFTLTVNGTNYVASSVVNFNGVAKSTTVVSATQLTAAIPASDIATAGSFPVTVFNPAPGGGTSAAINLAVNNPVPAITTLSPAAATVGGAAFTLTVNGTGFVNGAVVNFGGAARATTFVSATQVTAAILAADIAVTGTIPVTVTNPAPGGGTSVAANFNVNNPLPTITSLAPSSATAGTAAFTLTVNGTGFVAGAVVNFNGAAKTTTFGSATQVTAAILAADIAAGGAVNVTVTNPAPGGGTSAPATFTINNPLPTITTLSPNSATAGGAGFVLTVNGTGYVTGQSLVKFIGNAKTTTVVSPTQLTAPITAADIATGGTFPVTVTNAAPGGGVSAPVNFTVNNPVPTLTSIAPTSGVLGQSVNLVLTGTGFVAGSIINFGANADSGGVVSNGGNTLTITIPAAQLNVAGPVNVTVKNPAPGGGTTAAQTFTVNNPAPTLTSVAPTSGLLGQAANLTLTGTNFIAGSIVNFGANADAGGVVSNGGNTLTITIPALQLNAAGPVNITVKNPAPGGGTSGAVVFTVNNPVPAVTALAPASANAGGAAFLLTITGTNFVAGATVTFGTNPPSAPATLNSTQITVNIPAADIAIGGNFPVVVTNPAPGGGASPVTAASTFAVNNPKPTVATATVNGNNHVSGGAAFNLTVTGTLFVSTSVVNFNGKAEPTTFVSATQITAAIPASDAATAGTNLPVTVTNPGPGGGTSTVVNFTIDGFTVSGPANTPVKAGMQAKIVITITPTTLANGFTNAVTFSVSGLPAHSTGTCSPASVPSIGNAATTTTLTILTTSHGAAPPTAPVEPPVPPFMRFLPVLWLAAMLAGLAAMRLMRRTPQRRRYAMVVPLALLLLTGAALAGCSGGRIGTPLGPAPLTITATSGSMAVPTPANSVVLTVQ
jgi:hypothetical protein